MLEFHFLLGTSLYKLFCLSCLTHSPVDGCLGHASFQLLRIPLLWTSVEKLPVLALIYSCICIKLFPCIPRSETAGSYGNSMFNFLRLCQTLFHSSCTILNPQQLTGLPVSPWPCQSLLFLFLAVPPVRWPLTVVAREVECVFMRLFLTIVYLL